MDATRRPRRTSGKSRTRPSRMLGWLAAVLGHRAVTLEFPCRPRQGSPPELKPARLAHKTGRPLSLPPVATQKAVLSWFRGVHRAQLSVKMFVPLPSPAAKIIEAPESELIPPNHAGEELPTRASAWGSSGSGGAGHRRRISRDLRLGAIGLLFQLLGQLLQTLRCRILVQSSCQAASFRGPGTKRRTRWRLPLCHLGRTTLAILAVRAERH